MLTCGRVTGNQRPAVTAPLQDALTYHQRGDIPNAEALYRQVLAAQPEHPDALHLLGVLEHQRGNHQAASELIQQAISLSPGVAAFYVNLGTVFSHCRRLDDAAASYERAVALGPADSDTRMQLASGLQRLARLMLDASRYQDAISVGGQALALDPTCVAAHLDQASALLAQDKPEEAVSELRRVARLAPGAPAVLATMGAAQLLVGNVDRSISSFRRALRLDPNLVGARYNLGLALLLAGKLRQGWRAYESRGALQQFERRRGPVNQPPWNGRRLNGKRILVYAEQGLGDAIQFVRYAPRIAERGGRVVVECLPPLQRLFQAVGGIETLITTEDPLPEFDVYSPLLSLPRLFGTDLSSVPTDVPYVGASRHIQAKWRQRLASYSGLRIGLAWAGSPSNVHDAKRSITLDALSPLGGIPGVRYFSLQKRPSGVAPLTPPAGIPLVDLDPWLTDFAETAAAMESLDLIISVDTAVAHLAGALGRPVWIMLPFVPDWRWLVERQDSPWYPTARLFRQPSRGDWRSVIGAVRKALGEFRHVAHEPRLKRGQQPSAGCQ